MNTPDLSLRIVCRRGAPPEILVFCPDDRYEPFLLKEAKRISKVINIESRLKSWINTIILSPLWSRSPRAAEFVAKCIRYAWKGFESA